MKVLVTGGAGFIGSHVAERLTADCDVVVLDDLSGGVVENVPGGVRFIEGSIVDAEFVNEVFAVERPEIVYHLAAYAAEGLSHYARRFNYMNNVIGSANLITASVRHGVRGFVYTSSMAVYGSGQTPFSEGMPPAPEDPYGIAKYAVEMDLAAAGRLFGLKSVVFRPHNVYGERQNLFDRYRNVIGIFLRQVIHGQPLTIFNDGSQVRAFTYIGDIASVLAESCDRDDVWGETFNIGADQQTTVADLAQLVLAVTGSSHGIVNIGQRDEVAVAYSDHAKVRTWFGETQRTSLRDGLEKFWQWAQHQPKRAVLELPYIDLPDRLPEAWR